MPDEAVDLLPALKVLDLERHLGAVDPHARRPVLDEGAREEAVGRVHELVVGVLLERHPPAVGQFTLAPGDVGGERAELHDHVDVGAAVVVAVGVPGTKLAVLIFWQKITSSFYSSHLNATMLLNSVSMPVSSLISLTAATGMSSPGST